MLLLPIDEPEFDMFEEFISVPEFTGVPDDVLLLELIPVLPIEPLPECCVEP
ncbi:hypothetical protein GCM10023186_04000 [Hymenobacter koreensis]|uniref:Uncharacterized protein n=1 Tax=Hymenobacter koreensis TaxID=1084523 RepID=A0ABP8IU74_9BACT